MIDIDIDMDIDSDIDMDMDLATCEYFPGSCLTTASPMFPHLDI